jgi:hypothetical protein
MALYTHTHPWTSSHTSPVNQDRTAQTTQLGLILSFTYVPGQIGQIAGVDPDANSTIAEIVERHRYGAEVECPAPAEQRGLKGHPGIILG